MRSDKPCPRLTRSIRPYNTFASVESPEKYSFVIEYLKLQRSSGNKLILWTCRAGDALEKAVSWCRDQQLEFDAVNDNLPEIVEMYGTNSRKITCDFYIDDKAVLPAMVNG